MTSFFKYMHNARNWSVSRSRMYLNLSVVTDGFDGNRCFEQTVRIPRLQLNYGFCSPHQACHCAFILQKFFFLFLSNK